MPTYEYQCEGCGHRLEAFQSFSEAPLRKCPECGKRKLTRLIGAGGGLIFKGSGFYTTDYRDQSYHDAAKADRAPEAPKPDAKTDDKAGGKTGDKSDGKAGPAPDRAAVPTKPDQKGAAGGSPPPPARASGSAAGTRKK